MENRRRIGMMTAAVAAVAAVLGWAAAGQQFDAMFVFGDSLVDAGNNNYLVDSLAKANYVPYGLDFRGPTGSFSNGKTIVDFLGDLLELPVLPAYADPSATGKNVLKGINYASAAAGILNETGRTFVLTSIFSVIHSLFCNIFCFLICFIHACMQGDRFTFSQQIENFQRTLKYQLQKEMREEELIGYLNKSLVVISIGSNDYVNNYLLPSLYSTSYTYNPTNFADLLIEHFSKQLTVLHGLGLRKFLLGGIGPLGCIPNQLATQAAPQGQCVSHVNDMVELFNSRLRDLIDQLNRDLVPSVFVYGNTFLAFSNIITNASTYGFVVKDQGCCGISKLQITCLPFSVPCPDRTKYIFWDSFHPTQAVNQILAENAYSGPPSLCYPMNVQELAQQ
ncbi:hypothetical protein DM860_006458 [Cuscuta australis]|uniref:GDSL esterase/lipase n=1 Tax=Cuscuta australis TaxID=267555 RepID=A0A328D7D7_9ASTE|nr:hypothetical protein DM860_006458 [Cuscuta australis]